MLIFKKLTHLQHYLNDQKNAGRTISFVPTMGALHRGHLALVKIAKGCGDISLTSIYVNPAQFNNQEDLERYPRMPELDAVELEKINCDLLFLPDEKEIQSFDSSLDATPPLSEAITSSPLWTQWEAAFRPGHFEGVLFIVDRLLRMTGADTLIMGQKDYQQFALCRLMARERFPELRMIMGETMREQDGLAMSSRNLRLSPTARKKAPAIYEALCRIRRAIQQSISIESCLSMENEAFRNDPSFELEYLSVVDTHFMKEVKVPAPNQRLLVIIAVWLDGIRLIDNVLIE